MLPYNTTGNFKSNNQDMIDLHTFSFSLNVQELQKSLYTVSAQLNHGLINCFMTR